MGAREGARRPDGGSLLVGLCADTVDMLLSQSLRRIYIVDFNPFGSTTEPLMFTWEELTARTSRQGSERARG